jgi:hypothetical protein
MEDNVWRDQDDYLHYDLLLFTIIGVTFMEEGVAEFSAWSKAMLAEDDSGARRIRRRLSAPSGSQSLPLLLSFKMKQRGGVVWIIFFQSRTGDWGGLLSLIIQNGRLLIVQGRLRGGLAHFKLCAHFL